MGSKYFIDAVNTAEQTIQGGAGSDAGLTVTVDAGQTASISLEADSADWSITREDGTDDALRFNYNSNERLYTSPSGHLTRLTANTSTDADFKVKVDDGQVASVTLEEGTDDWAIENNGAANSHLQFKYNDTTYFEVSSNGFPVLPEYTVAGLPTGVSGGMIAVTDETGGYVPAFYDGTNWRRVTDRAIVS